MINDKHSIRPAIAAIATNATLEHTSDEEKFQNQTLRPIIKMQHELLISFFQNYLAVKKIPFANLDALKKKETVARIFKTDNAFKTELRGLIIGHFTVEEFDAYVADATALNKRIVTMIRQRLLSTI